MSAPADEWSDAEAEWNAAVADGREQVVEPEPVVRPSLEALPGGAETREPWAPRNLAELEERPPVQPTLAALGFLYPGRRHLFSGAPESLKTVAAHIETLGVIRAGGRVVLIDLETGPWDTRDRLRDLGATPEELAAVLYVEPESAATPQIIAGLVALRPDLVVIDAAAGAYELQGLDDNKRQDVERFAQLYVHAFWRAGIATIVLDHVGKAAEQRGRFAIGSERKLGGVDVHLGFDVLKSLSRGHSGLVKVSVHKDRFGHLARPVVGLIRLDSDPDTHAITWTLEHDTNEATPNGEWQPTQLMEKVSHYLERQAEPVSRTVVARDVVGRKTYVLRAIDALLADGYAASADGRGSKLSSLKPFRVPDPFPPVPGNDPSTPVPPVPTPSRGNGNRNGADDDLSHLEELAQEMGL